MYSPPKPPPITTTRGGPAYGGGEGDDAADASLETLETVASDGSEASYDARAATRARRGAREGARERATRSDATRGVAREEATALDDMEASRGLRAPARVSDTEPDARDVGGPEQLRARGRSDTMMPTLRRRKLCSLRR